MAERDTGPAASTVAAGNQLPHLLPGQRSRLWALQTFFGLDMKETFATWTTLETILSVAGLLATLALSSYLL